MVRFGDLALAAGCATALLLFAVTLHAQDANNALAKPVVVTLSTQPDTVDPMTTIGMPAVRPPIENVCETLVGVSHEGKLMPTLATWTVSPNSKMVDFHLKPGVKFHSGATMTADDLIFSHERGMAKSANYRNSIRGIDHLEKLDNLTVRFVFKQPNIGVLTARQLFIEGKAYYDKVGEAQALAHPDCTGPYEIKEVKTGQYIDETAFGGYWGGKPSIPYVRFAFIADDNTRTAMLRSGESDVNAYTQWSDLPALQKAGFHFARVQTFPTAAINFDLNNPDTPWANPKVRLAIAHAIDTGQIIKGLLGGVPQPLAMMAPGEVGYDPSLKPYSYDVALARKLMAEAGYANGFTMPFYVPTGANGLPQTATAIALFLKQININVDVKTIDVVQNQALLQKRSKDPTLEYTSLRSMPLANYGDPATSIAFSLSPESPTSLYKSSDPDFGRELDEATGELDDAKRAGLVQKALKTVYDEAGIIVMWGNVQVIAMKPEFSFTPIQHWPFSTHLIDLKRN